MPLQKQQVAVNFQKGLDTKSDPWQVPIGNFLELENTIFTKQGLLQKRNGFDLVGQINDSTVSTITTYNNELTALGNSLYAYNQSNQSFVNKGNYFPTKFNSVTLVKDSLNQGSVDAVCSTSGLTCVVYSESYRNSPAIYKFSIVNTSTGQNVLPPVTIDPNGGSVYSDPRVVIFQNNFVILFPVDNGGTYSIKFIYINLSTLAYSSAQPVAPTFSPSPAGTGVNWDCITTNQGIAVGYNVAGLGFYVNYILTDFTAATPLQIDAAHQATCVGVTTDLTNAYFVYSSSATGNGYVLGVTLNAGIVTQVFAPTLFVAIPPVVSTIFLINLTASLVGTTISILYEVQFPYSYSDISSISNLYSNYILLRTCSTSGVLGAAPTAPLFRGAGLASKAISVLDKTYFLISYDDGPLAKQSLQPTYFLVNSDGKIINRFSYRNGNGYFYTVLPSISLNKFLGTFNVGSSLISNLPDSSIFEIGQRLISNSLPINNVYVTRIVDSTTIEVSEPSTVTANLTTDYFYSNVIQIGYLTKTSTLTYAAPGYPYTIVMNKSASLSNIPTVVQYGSSLAQIELFSQSIQSVETDKNLMITGGFLWNYDGYNLTENNFLIYPSQICVEGYNIDSGTPFPTGSLTASLAVGTPNYAYAAIYQWTDNQGNVSQSTAVPVDGSIYPNVNLTGNLTLGSNKITNVSNISRLQSGMTVTNASIATGSGKIQKINYNTQEIYLNNNATATSVGAVLTCTARTANVIYIPTLRLSYKTNVVIHVYRWGTGLEIYKQLTNPQSPLINDATKDYVLYVDTLSDAEIQYNSNLYTTGDVSQNQAISCCGATTVFDNRLWLVNSENPSLLSYSKQVLSATPVEMTIDNNYFISPTQTSLGNSGPVTTLAVLDDKLIIAKPNSLYYVNGSGPDNTGANSQYSEAILISATIGCSNPDSVAVIPNGLMMQGNKGIWLLGRDLSTSYIGAPVESFTQNAVVVSAKVIPKTNQVRFMLNTGITLMYDYFYNQWGTFTGIPALSSTIYQSAHAFLNKVGQVCLESATSYLDITNPVLMRFKTNWYALGGLQGFQRAYFIFLLGKYYSPHKLNVELAYDFNEASTQSILITPDNYASIFGNDPFYGSSDTWGGPSQVEKWRIMLERQKCDSVQLSISEVFDPSYGTQAGQGLSLSGLNFIIGVKKGYGPVTQFNTAG